MPSNFIFVESIQKIIKNGDHEIKVSKGTKISPAAFDLIKENNITIIHEAESLSGSEKPPLGAVSSVKKNAVEKCETKVDLPEKNTDDTNKSTADITQEDVDQITQRVIDRLKELKTCEHEIPDADPSCPDDDLVICRCEEITKKEIKAVIRSGINTLNGIKRVTRSGMGLCQGQTCQTLVTRILAEELGIHPSKLEPTTARAPVRPVRLAVFAGQGES
ncbi:MAG: hypothetical protein HOG03_02260 [Desulfobacula sp.]|jgi:bacterioferritin-associated ferredoxin|uniref:(2Fe-2S)-binding protein n=1 Tax=Desulfobacula sp. TaxID=2593537 RepID=UPI001DF7F1F7|nr:hypothetical protein [Desulfobacula sp.]MBT3485779.1 hypothetical protein [Desulfobacula sp.]MBT3803403.1 hypothetical protein [Desulfobacula sp.]MBT4024324.1 hypothetical protein [Desulfobacula sp.]MBT4199635.1 hypothetical protein [Desulfobacula sp.]